MSDDFLDKARRSWRGQEAEIAAVGVRLRWGRRYSDLMLAVEAVAGLASIGMGAGMIWLAAWRSSPVLLIAGLTTLLIPPICWLAWRARRAEPRWAEETPEGVLRGMILQTGTTLRLMRLLRVQGVVFLAATAALWVAAGFGWTPVGAWLGITTGLWLACAAATFAWASWREAGARRERERCERLLGEFG